MDEQGNAIEIADPLLSTIQAAVQGSEQGDARVKALLSIEANFGQELPQNGRFVVQARKCPTRKYSCLNSLSYYASRTPQIPNRSLW